MSAEGDELLPVAQKLELRRLTDRWNQLRRKLAKRHISLERDGELRRPIMRQIKASIPDELADALESEAQTKGHSLSEAVRDRLLRAEDRWRPDIAALLNKIAMAALMVEISTGREWREDPATAYVLSLAIAALLRRYGADENAPLAAGTRELPTGRLVGADDAKSLAVAIEAMVNQADMFGLDMKRLQAGYEGKYGEKK
jgi:hypothetical protein